MKQKKKSKPIVTIQSPFFPNPFMEHVLDIQATDHRRYGLFSWALRRSAEIYAEQRDRAAQSLAQRKEAA